MGFDLTEDTSICEPIDSFEKAFLARARRWSYNNSLIDCSWRHSDSVAVCVSSSLRSLYIGRISTSCFGVVLFSHFLLECSSCSRSGDIDAFATMHSKLSGAMCVAKQADAEHRLAGARSHLDSHINSICQALRAFAETLTDNYQVIAPRECFEAILAACRSNLRGWLPKDALHIGDRRLEWPLY